jgi:dTDP-4-dehydrorhamnose 3,5-epimerase-like enzyme
MNATPKQIIFPKYKDTNGSLYVYESGKHLPFTVNRIFTVIAGIGCIRGEHAHRHCSQILVCISGKIEVICDTGLVKTSHILADAGNGLLIPPGIWAKQIYLTQDAVLMVMCDLVYSEADYIRNYDKFKKFIDQWKVL